MTDGREYVRVYTKVRHETAKAYMIRAGVFLPKSLVTKTEDDVLIIPKWLADKEGLDYEEGENK